MNSTLNIIKTKIKFIFQTLTLRSLKTNEVFVRRPILAAFYFNTHKTNTKKIIIFFFISIKNARNKTPREL